MNTVFISIINPKTREPVFHERVNIAHIVETRKHDDLELLVAVLVNGQKRIISQSDLIEHSRFHVSEFSITRK